MKSRWCTRHLKLELIDKHLKDLRKKYEVIQYTGIAADEDYRLERSTNQDPNNKHPLRLWGWDEETALRYCYARGYDWEGLYELKKNPKTGRARVSCWCCPLQSYDDLRTLRKNFPGLWCRLLELDKKQCKSSFQHGQTVADFERRFTLEDALTEAGESITNRAFFADLKRLLAGEATIEGIIKERTTKD
jgi:3'-phosphoadenosine 5'-phosphosulfate sulfotransferase (PAPS reductase)/FAD synthetase